MLKPAPLVSIVLPTFNRLKFLPAAVGSILAQTFTDWELIIGDDGSDKQTREYLRTLAERPRVGVLWLPHSGRPAVARNAALRKARGEYVAFMDSDDLWVPRKLEIQIASLQRQVNCAWSQTDFVLMNAVGAPFRTLSVSGGWILEKLVREQTTVALPSIIVRRERLLEVGAFDETFATCEDYELWWRLAERSEIDAIHEPLTLVRRHAEHYADDVACLEDLSRIVDKMQRRGTMPHLQAALTNRRAAVAAALVMAYARRNSLPRVLKILVGSAPCSWRYRGWWLSAFKAIFRTFMPAAALQILHRYPRS